MSQRTIVITGATDGLGRALATALSAHPDVALIVHGRDEERLGRLVASLERRPATVRTVRADLAEMASVRRLADDIAELTDRLTVLVNNAGIGAGEPGGTGRELTTDGHELRFAVNQLAPFALTRRLLPLLDRGAPARIVNVASIGQAPIDFDDLTLRHGYTGARAYGQSKLAMVAAGFSLADRLDAGRVTVNSIHPATYMPTKMVMESIGHSVDSLAAGRDATLRLVLDPDLDGVTGQFFDGTRPARAHPDAYDPGIRQRIWELSTRLTAGGQEP